MKNNTLIIKTIVLAVCCAVISVSFFPFHANAGYDVEGRLNGTEIISGRIYSIRSVFDSPRYIDVTNGLTDDGSDVWTYPYNGALCQEWEITKVSGTDEYMIKDMHSGKYLSIWASSSGEGANAWIWHNDGTSGQRFHFEYVSGNRFIIKTKCSGYNKALAIDSVTHNISCFCGRFMHRKIQFGFF